MTKPEADYAQMREEILTARRENAEQQFNYVMDEIDSTRQAAEEYRQAGDREGAKLMLENLMGLEADAQSYALEVERCGGGRNQPSEAKQRWLERRQDLVASHPKSLEIAGWWHNHITQNMGVPDESPQYWELMQHGCEQPGYQPMITPDEVVKMTGITPKEYNKGVRELHKRKAAGEYQDK